MATSHIKQSYHLPTILNPLAKHSSKNHLNIFHKTIIASLEIVQASDLRRGAGPNQLSVIPERWISKDCSAASAMGRKSIRNRTSPYDNHVNLPLLSRIPPLIVRLLD